MCLYYRITHSAPSPCIMLRQITPGASTQIIQIFSQAFTSVIIFPHNPDRSSAKLKRMRLTYAGVLTRPDHNINLSLSSPDRFHEYSDGVRLREGERESVQCNYLLFIRSFLPTLRSQVVTFCGLSFAGPFRNSSGWGCGTQPYSWRHRENVRRAD